MSENGIENSPSNETASGKAANRLAGENSPYLLQHSGNPVDWYPWGAEAFARAEKEGKPVFLSIGYSACHWCHVMERESFEDQEVAHLLNEHFVPVKVDREERPDIDKIYMRVCQAMTGSGGWPLTVIMAPDRKPFFAGTYFPKTSRYGRPGLLELLQHIAGLWKSKREELLAVDDSAAASFFDDIPYGSGAGLAIDILERAYREFRDDFDEIHGGFGAAPKFPSPHNLAFILRWWRRSGDGDALGMVEHTLDRMRLGGMYDHLGYGFHRYSTDREWLVPHFEKMLYDQAMISISYLEAYQATGKKEYAEIAGQVFRYVLEGMASPEGGFYSSEDADSEGEEGRYYTWERGEVTEVLGGDRADLFSRFFGITEKGQLEGRNVLHVVSSAAELAGEYGMETEELESILEQCRRNMLAYRRRRIPPGTDDKVLTDWNGLMIAALARGSQVLESPEYADAAAVAADFILDRMRSGGGRLLHRYRRGEAAIPAYLDDYAFLIWGLIELYEATFDARRLEAALELTGDMIELFWDERGGGFYFSASDGERVLSRIKDVYDGAAPSGNSVAALNLARLGRIAMNGDLIDRSNALIDCLSGMVERVPTGLAQLLVAFDFLSGPGMEIVIAGNPASSDTKRMLRAVRDRFMPGKVLILAAAGKERNEIERLVPIVKDMKMIGGRATAYVCENYSCKSPVTSVVELIDLLE